MEQRDILDGVFSKKNLNLFQLMIFLMLLINVY